MKFRLEFNIAFPIIDSTVRNIMWSKTQNCIEQNNELSSVTQNDPWAFQINDRCIKSKCQTCAPSPAVDGSMSNKACDRSRQIVHSKMSSSLTRLQSNRNNFLIHTYFLWNQCFTSPVIKWRFLFFSTYYISHYTLWFIYNWQKWQTTSHAHWTVTHPASPSKSKQSF